MQPAATDETLRLTGYLRSFAGVSPELSRQPVLVDERLVRRKQKIQRAGGSPEKNWSQLKAEIAARCAGPDLAKLQTELRQLHKSARDIVGDEVATGAVDSAAAFLYTLFATDQRWSREHAEKIRKTLGPFPASAANRACESVKKIVGLSPEKIDEADQTNDKKLQDGELKKEFGHNIVFSSPKNLREEIMAFSGDEKGGRDRLQDSLCEEDTAEMDTFSQALLLSMAQKSKTRTSESERVKSKTKSGVGREVGMVTGDPAPYSSEWFARQLRELCGGDAWQELYMAVFDLLSSTVDTSAIQGDLVELLGYSHLDLIGDILTHREQLVSSCLHNSPLLLSQLKDKDIDRSGQTQSVQSSKRRPTVSSQVVIQSGEEKALRKQMRKEEKRLARSGKREGGGVGDDHVAMLRAQGFDPEQLRKQRERALEEASLRPLLLPVQSSAPDPSQLYPHVYDSLAKARHTAAYIAGAKVVVPEDAVRKSDRMMEEFQIPHSSAPPPPVGEERIRIAEVDDDLIQIAFQGTKTLNRIQSVVFEVAYYTSENLLISAPTGAGKTNIAMLTVLREIRNNMEGRVIQRDKFKIVYVAPMKALAAEMVRNFSGRLAPLGITVRELTGDMQLTKSEIRNTQMIVTTPEKWDVVTRKATGDVQLAQIVRLLIIDEIHLLHEDRGAVLESLVARTLRQVESSQTLIRIVGLSATLPNYIDVARFLRVNPYNGLFFFDGRFRPVPLSQTFVGVKATNMTQQMRDMEEVCYEKVLSNVKRGYQVMVFVHARNATVRTATALRDLAASSGDLSHFQHEQTPRYGAAEKQVMKSRNKQLRDLFSDGFSIHHAGMLRVDRSLVERLFSDGYVKVLVCTATLAWGVNLPAHAVIIKGTQVYNAQKGSFIDLGILDVLQIFGRAGRPQYDTYGEGTIITTHSKLSHYVTLMTRQHPIESRLKEGLRDNLNAEIALGTVTSVEEAIQWLSYTYLYVRMRLNPLVYGIPSTFRETDPTLELYMRGLIEASAKSLMQARMIRYVEHTGSLHSTDLGRTASHYYINTASIETFNELLKPHMNEAEMMAMVAKSEEFEQVKVREDEQTELEQHRDETCVLPVRGGVENSYGKVNILLQVYISREAVDSFSLTSDLAYVAQNAGRIIRGLFEIVLRRGWPVMAARLLTLCRSVDRQLWSFQHPLRQFEKQLSHEVLKKIEARKMDVHHLKDMTADEIGHMIHHPRMGTVVKKVLVSFPSLLLAATIQPITRTVLRVRLIITPDFEWDDRIHGSSSEPWWLWVEDADSNSMYHSEYFFLQKKQVIFKEAQELVFAIPISDPLPPQYIIRLVSDRWLGAEATVAISFKHLILPEIHPPHTGLLDLHPLPITALKNTGYESLFSFSHFNPVQTQVFHTLYHSDANVLLGAPTGSGKTIAAELAIFRVFNCYPGGKAVYIAPLKALVRERVDDWNERMEQRLGKRVVELTGDSSPDIRAIERADVIVTTPEKWDGISRSWQNRAYVQAVCLLVIDEIHLLGDERGPVLEVIVSRTNFIASHTEHKVRVVGLSTALANARDLADWLEIGQVLLQVLADHLNAEIVSSTVTTKQDALDYLTWTYFFRRLLMNPSYYQLQETDTASVNSFLTNIVSTSLSALQSSHCISIEEDDRTLVPLTLGCISSYYYLHHTTVRLFRERLHAGSSFEELLLLLSDCAEYDELPVRHNEDSMNASLAPKLPIPVSPDTMDSPHTKTHLLLQAHFSRAPLPIADYGTDTKSVLDQALRILQAMIDVTASEGWLAVTLRVMTIVQMCIQGRWASESSLLILPYLSEQHVDQLNKALSQSRALVGSGLREVVSLAELMLAVEVDSGFVMKTLSQSVSRQDLRKLTEVLSRMPKLTITWRLKSPKPDKPVKPDSETHTAGRAVGGARGQRWIDVGVAEECVVVVEITRNSQGKYQGRDSRAHAPKFPKSKDEGWWALIGEVDSGELLALKRLGFVRSKSVVTLAFTAPEEPCRKIYTLYFISDCYLGLDQQHDMCFNFVATDNE